MVPKARDDAVSLGLAVGASVVLPSTGHKHEVGEEGRIGRSVGGLVGIVRGVQGGG